MFTNPNMDDRAKKKKNLKKKKKKKNRRLMLPTAGLGKLQVQKRLEVRGSDV